MESGEAPDFSTLRVGQRVLANGRPAIIVYPHPGETAVVVRYDGEHDNRVVSLRKLDTSPQPPKAA